MRRLVVVFLSCVVPIALLAAAANAGADVFAPISLVSESSTQQADYAHDPAISGDGRFLAFDGSFGAVAGVWLRDLATGTVEQVAGGDAELPSISDDGRYISFTTNEDLEQLTKHTSGLPDPEYEKTQEPPNVYVRDMAKRPTEGGAFTLASAVTGGTASLKYEYSSEPAKRKQEEEHYGSVAAGRSAISADGNEVTFVTSAISNLANPAETKTPALQVAVRYLDTRETRLVSVHVGSSDEPVSTQEGEARYGAVFTGLGGKAPAFGPPPVYGEYGETPPLGASISADGSTVAWMGDDIGEQAPLLFGESRSPHYTEPLWRRITPGSETPTRRITGGSDPANPACIASGETVLPASASLSNPCQGPFATPEGEIPGIWAGGGPGAVLPRLSADGYTVAFTAQAPLVSLGEDFGTGLFGRPSDLYVVNMREGLTRAQALTPLTELASGEKEDRATDGPIMDFGISPDGTQVAFTTERTQFPLGSPAYVSAPAAEPGMTELLDADLADQTLTRVTQGFEGGLGGHPHAPVPTGRDPYKNGDGALSPSFSDNGAELAFSSTASNLVYGDGNTPPRESGGPFDGSDAFVVSRVIFGSTPTPQYVSSAPAPSLMPAWTLGVSALSRPDGSAELYVEVPGAGKLRALARGVVLIRPAGAARVSRHSRRSASRRGRGRAATVATRTVAVAGAYPASDGLLALTLKLAKPYASLASARGGLSASVNLAFTALGHPTLYQRIDVTFVRTIRVPPARGGRAADRRRVRGSHRR